jgi:hypothetical protein
MASLIYEIINEFRFEAQSALINMDAVQNAAAGISNSIDNLFKKVSIIPQMLSSSLGMSFGASGLLYGAVSSFENLQKNSLAFANIISSNLDSLEGPITTFNDRMAASDALLKDFAKTAQKFSLDEGAFIQTTKMLTAQLVPKGLAGTNFGTAKEMSRGLLKSAPILGVDPNFVQGELLRSMEGSASLNDTLFRRLAAETKVFRDLKKGVVSEDVQKAGGFKGNVKVFDSISKMFNALPAASRVEVLTQALTQFGDDADVAAGNANLLSNKLMSIKNQLTGVNGVLQPLGAVIVPKLRIILDFLSKMIETHVRPAIEKLSGALGTLADDAPRTFATLYQLRNLQRDLGFADVVAQVLPIIIAMRFVASLLGRFPQLMQGVSRGIILVFERVGLGGLGVAIAAGMQRYVVGPMVAFFARFSFGNIIALLWQGFVRSFRFIFIGGFSLLWANFAKVMTVVKFAFSGLLWILRSVLLPVILTTAAFQVLSRAMGYAKILDIQNWYKYSTQMMNLFQRLVRAFALLLRPIDDVIDAVARMIAPLFGVTYLAGMDIIGKVLVVVEGIVAAVEFLAHGLINFLANFQGIVFAIMQLFDSFFEVFSGFIRGVRDMILHLVDSVTKMDFNNIMTLEPFTKQMQKPLEKVGVAYNAGYEDVVGRYMSDINNPNKKDKAIVNRNTNIDKVVINNAFKEQLEPDRIANSLVKTLMEVADNPRQGATGGLATGFFR